jgi:hypothetical protein
MAAIALAESGGRSGVVNSIGACGIWQIHPSQAGCTNANKNAKMAVAKYRSQGLTAWEAYTNGSYRKFLKGNPPPPSGTGGGVTTTGIGSGIAGGILGSLINPDMIQRFGLIVFGAFLIIVGVMLLAGGKTMELVKDTSGSKKSPAPKETPKETNELD